MQWIPKELKAKAAEAHKGEPFPSATVRELLGWFHSYKRGKHVVAVIDKALKETKVTTWPHFNSVYLDGRVEIRPISEPRELSDEKHSSERAVQHGDPVPRLAQLSAANSSPVSVTRDAPLSQATTLMMAHDYSQLPVMQGERSPDGFVSWKTIGIARARGEDPKFVRDALDHRVHVLLADTPLFQAVAEIAREDFILVEGAGKKITGLVTTSDVSLQFHDLARPFLLVSEIEGHLRRIIDMKYSSEEISSARDPADEGRSIEGAADLNFGEYLKLLEKPERWEKLGLDLDRKVFLERLERVRLARNDIMHFRPDPIEAEDLDILAKTSRFLELLAGD